MSRLHLAFCLIIALCFLACQKEPKAPSPVLPKQEKALFQLLKSEQTGINFNPNGQFLFKGDPTGLYSNVSAVAAGDINNDGLVDLFFSGGHQNSGLYLNLGDLKFKNISSSAGIVDRGDRFADTEGVNFVDINGDGLLDIYVMKTGIRGNFSKGQFEDYGANLLFINQGNNQFKESAKAYGLGLIGLSHTANFFDYDADGDLDVYMGYTAEPGASFSFPYYQKPPRSKWLNDQFLENVDGQYVDVRKKAGLPFERNLALSVSVGDINNDGYGDIYVANDFFGRDFFFLNKGNKTFEDAHDQYFTKAPMSAMGSDFADINNDGWVDLFVGEMMPPGSERQKQNLVPFSIDIYNRLIKEQKPQYTRNMLQINQSGQQFRDIGLLAGVHASEWSWSSFFADLDNDGYKDLFVANGILRDLTNMDFVKDNFGNDYTSMADPDAKSKVDAHKAPVVKTPNYIYKNNGDYQFTSKNSSWGLHQAMQTRGATYADLDNDGDLDLILNNMDESPIIYKNLASEQQRGNYLKIRLKAKLKNTFGIGARVDLRYGEQQQSNYLSNQRGFQSCPEPLLYFGLGQTKTIDTLIVTWPGGKQEIHLNIAANQLLQLEEGKGQGWAPKQKGKTPLLIPVKKTPAYTHKENNYSDFKKDRILVQRYSREGPGMAVGDVNQDGTSDLLAGGAGGQNSQLFIGTANGSFNSGQAISNNKLSEALGLLFFDANGDGAQDIYISGGSDESLDPNLPDQLYLNDGTGNFTRDMQALPPEAIGSKVVSANDYDQDGDVDLFISRRYISGAKTVASPCYILQNNSGKFTVTNSSDFGAGSGEISAAIWTDVNNDGKKDLALAGRWMPLTFYIQDNNAFTKKTITQSEGWWNSITASDVDNDGDMDYILGNHGLNSIFKASAEQPMTLAYGDFDGNGNMDPLVFQYTNNKNTPFVNKDLLTSHMPVYNKRFYNFKQYATASFDNMVPDSIKNKTSLHYAKEMRSGIYINEGNFNFRFIPLSNEAQTAPVFGIISEDLNEDGLPDILLCGNSNANHFEYGDIDALNGLLLLGNGDGTFRALSKDASGFEVKGSGKAMVIWPKAPNTLMITVSQNDGPVRSFQLSKNIEIISCPAGKSSATVQLKNGQSRKWEYSPGGGYLSQSAPIILKTQAVQAISFD